MARYPGPVNPELLHPWQVLSPESIQPASPSISEPNALFPSQLVEPAPLPNPFLPFQSAGQTPNSPFPFSPVGQMPAGLPEKAKPQSLAEYYQQQANKHRREEAIRMEPKDFADLTQELLKGPLFSDLTESIQRNQAMAGMFGKLQATPDLSPLAQLLGMDTAPFRGSPGGLPMIMDTLQNVQKQRQERNKEALAAAKQLVVGKTVDESGSIFKLLESLGVKPGGKSAEEEDRKYTRYLVKDFMGREDVKTSIAGLDAGYRAYEVLEKGRGSATSLRIAQKMVANMLEKGKLTNEDVADAGAKMGWRGTYDKVIARWKTGTVMPEEVGLLKEALLNMMRGHADIFESQVSGASESASGAYSLTKNPEELKGTLRTGAGVMSPLNSLRGWEAKRQKILNTPPPKPAPSGIDVKSLLEDARKQRTGK